MFDFRSNICNSHHQNGKRKKKKRKKHTHTKSSGSQENENAGPQSTWKLQCFLETGGWLLPSLLRAAKEEMPTSPGEGSGAVLHLVQLRFQLVRTELAQKC